MKIEASFVISAARAADLPRDGLAEIAFVGRSNVGKSSLINALTRQKVARTSAAPGKTRLANVYRVVHGAEAPFYLVDLPGYGYARGGETTAREFEELTRGYFGRDRQDGQDRLDGTTVPADPARIAALLLVDARHPALVSDLAAWSWLQDTGVNAAIIATKVDKLSRAERLRAMKANDAAFEHPVLPVSAVTGEGLDELWTLISRIQNNPRSHKPLPRPSTRLGAALSASKGRRSPVKLPPPLPRRKS